MTRGGGFGMRAEMCEMNDTTSEYAELLRELEALSRKATSWVRPASSHLAKRAAATIRALEETVNALRHERREFADWQMSTAAERDRLAAEVAALRRQLADADAAMKAASSMLSEDRDAYRDEAAALREAAESLIAFAQHADGCGDPRVHNRAVLGGCNCGLDAAIDAARGEENIVGYGTDGLTFNTLREANARRNEEAFSGSHLEWGTADWVTALVGEVGEFANFAKKYKRGDLSFDDFQREARKELADVQCYLDLLAAHLNIDLGRATQDKFNEVSERIGSPIYIDGPDWRYRRAGEEK